MDMRPERFSLPGQSFFPRPGPLSILHPWKIDHCPTWSPWHPLQLVADMRPCKSLPLEYNSKMGLSSFVRLANLYDSEEVGALRESKYRAAGDFRLAGEELVCGLRWSEQDEQSIVLGVWSDGQLVATMRAERVADLGDALYHFDGMFSPDGHVEWPCPILTRAATRSESRASVSTLFCAFTSSKHFTPPVSSAFMVMSPQGADEHD